MGLHESYTAVRGQVLLMNPFPSIRQAYSLVTQEEKQRLLSSTHTISDSINSAAMAVQGRNNRPIDRGERTHHPVRSQGRFEQDRDNFGGGRRFDNNNDRRNFGPRRGRPQCSHCGDHCHWVQTCYELYGYPTGHPKARNNQGRRFNGGGGGQRYTANHVAANSFKHDERVDDKSFHVAANSSKHTQRVDDRSVGISEFQLKQFLSLLNDKPESSGAKPPAVTKPGLPTIASRNWIIDNGATDHISSSPFNFQRQTNYPLPPVLLPSGATADIVTKGTLPLNSCYYLHDDLATRRMIGLGKQRNRLYYLVKISTKNSMVQPTPPSHQTVCNLTISSTDLWHKRLGHISPKNLTHYGPIPLLTHGPFTSSPPDTSPPTHSPFYPSPHTSSLPLSPPSLPTLTNSTLPPSLPSPTTTTTQPPPILHTYTRRPKSSNPDPPPSCSHNIPSLPRDLPRSPEPPSPPVQVRRSGRHTAPPAKLKDYVCSTVSSHQSSPWQPGSTKDQFNFRAPNLFGGCSPS
uniref:GAG-pre-integrase domain-containing protein n=1 Tax=Populus alba TaxID=43335 RepID=A0A4U5PRT7_POPAL|nr:hypothetical protein D5086_0000187380 [Populus alba]